MHLNKGDIIANRYQIKAVIGSGGMAIVYRAKDKKLERDVTLKVMREEYIRDDEFTTRFNIEAKAAAKLNHPNIVNVYDVGRYDDIYFIVMEFIDGVTLKDLIVNRGKFDNEEILGVAIQIASALEEAHVNNIVHRDIKPQNILVTTNGDVKVTDFGIARAVNANTITTGNNTMGSVHYFSPEQARGGYIDQKSDIYSLGITMYEMATGEVPFNDDTVVAIALKHLNDPIPNIIERNPDISESVNRIILKATQKLSTDRYDSIVAMNEDLKRGLTNCSGDFVKNRDFKEKTHTVKISKNDIEKIRIEAMTTFYDENFDLGESEGNHFGVEDPYEKKKGTKDKWVVLGAVLSALLIVFLLSYFVVGYLHKIQKVKVDIPVLTGKSLQDARNIGNSLGVTVTKVKESYNDTIPVGDVIKQDFNPGDNLYTGGTISVEVSLGTDKITVPDVVNKSTNDADVDFEPLPIKLTEKYAYSDSVDMHNVISEEPPAGTLISNGDEVVLTISLGKQSKKITVPNVVGVEENAAKQKIVKAGLVVGAVNYSFNSTIKKGIVISQNVDAGNEIFPGASVGIAISKGADTAQPSDSPKPSTSPKPTSSTNNNSGSTSSSSPSPSSAVKTKTIKVSPVNIPDGYTSIKVKVIKLVGSDGEVEFEDMVDVNKFPISIKVSGTGKAEIQVYAYYNDQYNLQGRSIIDFDS